MTTRPSRAALDIWRRLLHYHRATTVALDRELREATGMDLDEYDVLVQLVEGPDGRRRMGELVASTLIARSSCTRVVDRLVRRGWAVRDVPAEDRRGIEVAVTTSGRAAFARAAVVHLRGIERRFARPLSADDLAALDRVLGRLEEAARD